MDRVWVVTHERFRNDNESYNVLAAFKTEQEAHAAMIQYGRDIETNEYYDKCIYDSIFGTYIFRIKENDISCMITQEDILKIILIEIKKFDFNQNKILGYVNSNRT